MPPRPRTFEQTAHRRVFGDRVRFLRLARGFSQERLAESSGLDRTYVVGVERGRRNPSLDSIFAIAQGLSVTVADLFPQTPDAPGDL